MVDNVDGPHIEWLFIDRLKYNPQFRDQILELLEFPLKEIHTRLEKLEKQVDIYRKDYVLHEHHPKPCPDPFNISPELEKQLKNAGVKIDRVYIGNEVDRIEITVPGKPVSEMQYGEAQEKRMDEIHDKHICELHTIVRRQSNYISMLQAEINRLKKDKKITDNLT